MPESTDLTALAGVARVERSNLFESIAAKLEELVLSGQLAPGSRLPTEKELSAHFQVSRPVIREALSRVSDRGLIRTRTGAGTFVRAVDGEQLRAALSRHLRLTSLDRDGVRDLYEARTTIEVACTRRATIRATDEDRDRILGHLEEMRARPRIHLEADLGFHRAIAAASHNQLLETLLQPLVETIQQGIAANYHLGRVAIQQGMEGHEEIWAAIAARRPDDAAAAMGRHLAVSERQLSLALHLEPDELDEPDSHQ